MFVRNRTKIIGLLFLWILALLAASAVSPSYLVEGMRTVLEFRFSSKETYADAVIGVRFAYILFFTLLSFFTAYSLLGVWRKNRQSI